MRWRRGWCSTASVSCGGEGGSRGAVRVSNTLLYPPTPTHMHPEPTQPPDLRATEGIHARIPSLIVLRWALIGPPLGLPATTKTNSLGWEEMDKDPPLLSPCFSFFFLFFFFLLVEWRRGHGNGERIRGRI